MQDGWIVEVRRRTSGKAAGQQYKVWCNPAGGQLWTRCSGSIYTMLKLLWLLRGVFILFHSSFRTCWKHLGVLQRKLASRNGISYETPWQTCHHHHSKSLLMGVQTQRTPNSLRMGMQPTMTPNQRLSPKSVRESSWHFDPGIYIFDWLGAGVLNG